MGLLEQVGHDLGDALGLVAHAFQVDDDVHGGHDGAQVAGSRLLRHDQREALFFDFKAQTIDDAVGSKDLMGLVGVECCQRFQRQLELFLDAAAHEQDVVAQFTQLAVEMGAYVVIGSPLLHASCCDGAGADSGKDPAQGS